MSKLLKVDLESFPAKDADRARGIRTTLESVFDVFMSLFDSQPDAPVNVAWWSRPNPPQVWFDCRPYEIRINALGNGWSQYAYQFAHELCHVIINFDRVKKHKHKWFEESLCEMASLFVLYKLSELWSVDPPPGINGSRYFAPTHAQYARDTESKFHSPDTSELPQWIEANVQTLEKCSTERRDLNGVIAVTVLRYFQNDPLLWWDCTWLNQWDANNDRTFSEYLDSWAECLHRNNAVPSRAPAILKELLLRSEAASDPD